MVDPRSSRLSTASGRSFRFSRSAALLASNIERPPVILEFGPNMVRVGLAEQASPQHFIPWELNNNTALQSKEDWYFLLAPLVSKVYDCIMLDPATRRVVCVTPSLYMAKSWQEAIKQVLYHIGVPAICFISALETVPFAMGWKQACGVIHVGMAEQAQCIVIANGCPQKYTFQAVPCGYNNVVAKNAEEKVQVEWTNRMNTFWLDENNPNSLMTALLKCLISCPTDLKRSVISNLVFVGDVLILVPDLARQVKNRLEAILDKTATPFDEEPVSDFTVVPTECNALAPLASSVQVFSTAPVRADLVSWVGASLWATVWHRHENHVSASWEFPPSSESDS